MRHARLAASLPTATASRCFLAATLLLPRACLNQGLLPPPPPPETIRLPHHSTLSARYDSQKTPSRAGICPFLGQNTNSGA